MAIPIPKRFQTVKPPKSGYYSSSKYPSGKAPTNTAGVNYVPPQYSKYITSPYTKTQMPDRVVRTPVKAPSTNTHKVPVRPWEVPYSSSQLQEWAFQAGGGQRDFGIGVGGSGFQPQGGQSGGGGGGGNDYGGGGYGYGYGGGGGGEPAKITWSSFDSGVKGPSWWKALKPSSLNPGTEYLAAVNMMIPFLSPEDQRTVAATLYQQDAENFGHLNPDKIGAETPAITPELQKLFTSSDRAVNALSALQKLSSALGKSDKDMGSGYRYLQSILSSLKQFGAGAGENQITKANQVKLLGALDPMLAQGQSQSDLGAYGPMAKMLAQPFFSRGQLMPITKTQDGRYLFGEQNRELL